jgi:hypothetical protein
MRAVGEAALAADGAADADDFLAEGLTPVGELVEGAVEIGHDAFAGERQAHAEIALAGGLERLEERFEVGLRNRPVDAVARRGAPVSRLRLLP